MSPMFGNFRTPMAIIEIETLKLPGLAPYASLTEAAVRESGVFVAESPKVIERALDGGMEPISLLCERKHINGDAAGIITRLPRLPVYTGTEELLKALTGYRLTRGVLCAMKRPELPDASKLLEGKKRVCAIHDVCDATNIGVIFRTAAALGYDAVILSKGSCDPLNRRAARVSMGAVFQIPWAFADAVPALLKNAGIRSVCTTLGAKSVNIETMVVEPEGRYGLIFGSEGYGLPQEVTEACDHEVKIPMHHGVDSLNVGAAAAIILWHFAKR